MSHRTKAVRAAEKALTATLARELKAIGKAVAKKVAKLGKSASLDAAARHDTSTHAPRFTAASAYDQSVSSSGAILAKAEGDDEVDKALDGVDWTPIATAVEVQLTLVAEDGARKALAVLGVADDESITSQTFTKAVEVAKARAAELVGKSWDEDGNLIDNPNADMAISDTMRDEIRDAVADAIEAGDSAADLGDAIEELGSFSEARAMMIARTEIIRSHADGQLRAMRESGVVSKKAWSTSEDGDVCEDCLENEDAGDIDIDEDFPSGDDGPPCHPLDRCAVVAIIDSGEGEADDADAEEEDSDEEDDAADEQAAE